MTDWQANDAMLNLQIEFIAEDGGGFTATCLEHAAFGDTKCEALRALLYMLADVAQDYVEDYDKYTDILKERYKDLEVLR